MAGIFQTLLGSLAGLVKDAYYKYVTLLLTGNSPGGTVAPYNADASTNKFNLTQNGDVRNATFSPFNAGYYSAYLNNESANNSYLSVASNAAFAYGTGDFTAECWVYLTATPTADAGIIEQRPASTNGSYLLIGVNSSKQLFVYVNTAYRIGPSVSTAVSANTWNHVAYSRSSGTATLYLNGSSIGSWSDSTTYGNQPVGIGYQAFTPSNVYFPGYISNLRIVKGTAVYTSAFTPSTIPLTAISGTSLLTCQSNRFIDNSTNAFTITTTGSPAISSAQPFTLPTANVAYGAGYFDGNGDYLAVADSATLTPSADFTIELWVYAPSLAGTQEWYSKGYGIQIYSLSGNWYAAFSSSNTFTYYINVTFGAGAVNVWQHIAVYRSGNNYYGALNGVVTLLGTSASSPNTGTNALWVGGFSPTASLYATGYVSNVRYVNGTAVYGASNFTPPTTPLTAVANTSLLTLQSSYPAWNNGFLDGSNNNFLITRNGNTTQGTFTPYGANWSNSVGAASYISAASNAAFGVGTGDFTVECWVYPTAAWAGAGSYNPLVFVSGTGIYFGQNGTGFGLRQSGTADIISYGTSPTLNTWTHVAVVRSGTTCTLYYNGTSVATATSSANFSAGTLQVGSDGSYAFTGYISNVRLVKGTAVYTSTFTPSTTPLTAISGTSLLTCQSNRFVDNSSNAFAITVTGTPSVQRFSPFSPSSAYSTSVVGGSGYFDGTGDYLSVATNTALDIWVGDFTVECWAWLKGNQSDNIGLVNKAPNNASASWTPGWCFSIVSNALTVNTPNDVKLFTTGVTIPTYSWVHCVLVKSGSTVSIFQNGTRTGTITNSNSYSNTTDAVTIGTDRNLAGAQFNGYISNVRLVKGTAVYDPTQTTLTVPTAPLAAITNTSLLLLTTNAGVFDNAMMNDLETVGNAQISTTQSKFGGSSMYFDGTGDWLLGTTGNTNFQFGTGDFTVEMWVYTSNLAAFQTLIDTRAVDTASAWAIFIDNTGKPYWYDASGTQTSSTALTSNTWQHLAVARSGSTIKIFLSGTQVFSGANSNSQNSTGPFVVGRNIAGTVTYTGYIDDLRVTKGYARYTSSFTPPTAAFPTS